MAWRIRISAWKYYLGTPESTLSLRFRSDATATTVFSTEYEDAVETAEEELEEFKVSRNNSYTFFSTNIEWVTPEEAWATAPENYEEKDANRGGSKRSLLDR